jgi:hypothetical protein
MSETTLNSKSVIKGSVNIPKNGAFWIDVIVDTDEDITGAATFAHGTAMSLTCFVVKGGVDEGVWKGQLIGGNGGLNTRLKAKSYRRTFGRVILNDILTSSGETLSPTVSSDILGKFFDHWSRTEDTCARCLDRIATALGVSWRVLDDGTVFFGVDLFTESTELFTEERNEPSEGWAKFSDATWVRPFMSLSDGKKIVAVEHLFGAIKVRSDVYYKASGEPLDVAGSLRKMFDSQASRMRFFGAYKSKVTSQNATTFAVSLDPYSALIAGQTDVPMLFGVPGVRAKVTATNEGSLLFLEGDPSKPFASFWKSGETVTELSFAATTLRLGSHSASDPVVTESRLQTALDTIRTWLNTHTHPTAGTGSPSVPTTPLSPVDATGSPNVMAT